MITNNALTSNAPVKKTYKVEEIAAILGIGKGAAYGLVRQGHFKIVRIGTAIRISKQSFDEWLDSQNISS